jgi:hypothetical protein
MARAAKATSAKKPAAASKRPTAASSAATPSKDKLPALVEKLEASNATLRTKNRGANRAAKITAARIAELEPGGAAGKAGAITAVRTTLVGQEITSEAGCAGARQAAAPRRRSG